MSDWFVVNVADASVLRHEVGGLVVGFEPPSDRFAELGINLRVLEPGQPAPCTSVQEDFLVISGEYLAILMIGARRPDQKLHLPANELAARHGASVAQDTDSAAEANAEWGANFTPAKLDWPPS